MRTIKFRAWSHKVKNMFDGIEQCNSIALDDCVDIPSIDIINGIAKDWEVMQYTGLKDKNGVEIFESDICSVNGLISDVIFHRGSFMLRAANTIDFYRGEIEVIGNVFENPELLTK